MFEITNAPKTTASPTAEYIIVFLAPSNASGLPDDVIYLNPPQTKKPAATAPASVTNIWITFWIKFWTLETSAVWAKAGVATIRAVNAREDRNIVFLIPHLLPDGQRILSPKKAAQRQLPYREKILT